MKKLDIAAPYSFFKPNKAENNTRKKEKVKKNSKILFCFQNKILAEIFKFQKGAYSNLCVFSIYSTVPATNQSQNILRPIQIHLIFLKHWQSTIYTYSNALSPQINVVSGVQATWMTKTAHPNGVTFQQNIKIGERGIGLRVFVTNCSIFVVQN